MFKKIISAFVCMLFSAAIGAQSISVESFKLLETDLTANTAGTMKRDQNGDVAALIRIVTSETGFTFENGMMGIVASEQKTGEVWVYVPFGTSKLTIAHQQLGVLRDYYLPVPIEKGRTYEMRLLTGRVRAIVEDEIKAQYVTFSVEPKNAIVTIDDKQYSLQSDGTTSQLLLFGAHTYRVEAPGYKPESGSLQVASEKIKKEIVLKSNLGTAVLVCEMPEADLYLNGVMVGTGTWTGQREAALYQVEARREGYQTRTISFELNEQEEKHVTIPAPLPLYGSLSITSVPNEATVYLDGVKIGETPLLKSNLIANTHELEFRKKDYHPLKMTVKVDDGTINNVNAELSDSFSVTIHTNPEGALLYVDGNKVEGITPVVVELNSGNYELRFERVGYETVQKNMHLDPQNPEITVSLPKNMLKDTQFYVSGYYQTGGVVAIGGQVGCFIKGVNLELDYAKPGTSDKTVYWITDPALEDKSRCIFNTYALSYVMGAKAGYGIRIGNFLRITPQIGANIKQIDETDWQESDERQRTYAVCADVGLKVELSPFQHVALSLSSSYGIPVMKGEIAKSLDGSGVVDEWCKGFGVKMGVELYF